MSSSDSQQNPAKPAPVKPVERIVDLDILRGIALFGILVVNLYIFSNPLAILAVESDRWADGLNQGYLFFSRVFFEGKFITLFSFLFGLGFYIFTERLKVKGLPVRRIFFRRMVLLFLIGMLHAWLLWTGDILAPYAISGIIIMLFLYRKDKTIKVWMGIIAGGFLLLFSLMVAFMMWGMTIPDVADDIRQGFIESNNEFRGMLLRGYEIYAAGTFSEILAYRGEELSFGYFGLMITPLGFFYIIPIFLLGFLIGRQGLLKNPALLRTLFIPRRWKLFLSGFALSTLYATSYVYADPIIFNHWTIIQYVSIMLGAPMMMLGYCGFILKWLDENKADSLLHRFAPVGRMALTNYILQSVICTLIFYSYGFGLIGQFAPVYILPLAIAIFAIQVVASEWYFKKYKMGPLERLWRMGTYMRSV